MHQTDTPTERSITVGLTPPLIICLTAVLVSLKGYGPDPLIEIANMEKPPAVVVQALNQP